MTSQNSFLSFSSENGEEQLTGLQKKLTDVWAVFHTADGPRMGMGVGSILDNRAHSG